MIAFIIMRLAAWCLQTVLRTAMSWAPLATDRAIRALIERAERTPYFHLEGYMGRWWLLPYPSNKPGFWHALHRRFPIAARIHQIVSSDKDRCLHDHPWASASIILRGGYYEVLPAQQTQPPRLDSSAFCSDWRWRKPGDVVVRRAKDRHRLVLRHAVRQPDYEKGEDPATTLFITWRKTNDWGFYTPNGFVPWREYLDEPVVADAEAKLAKAREAINGNVPSEGAAE